MCGCCAHGDCLWHMFFVTTNRMLFAVVTFSAVFVYDTQHTFPLVKVSGMHYATLNDVSWSADGQMIVLCSSDGYVSFIRFPAGALGSYYHQ